jgi:hypothetical protein
MFTVVKSRHGGSRAAGHVDFVERVGINGKRVTTRNYINLLINNFDVADKGDLHDIVNAHSEDHDLSGDLL